MESSHTSELDIPELNAAASKAHVFPGMANHSLLSVGQLCERRLHGHFQASLSDNLQFREISNLEWSSGFEHWPLVYKFEATR
jgi:hypothetical protein